MSLLSKAAKNSRLISTREITVCCVILLEIFYSLRRGFQGAEDSNWSVLCSSMIMAMPGKTER